MRSPIKIDVTTATDGSATAYGSSCQGLVYAVQLVDGDLTDGVDVTLTVENENYSQPVLVQANFNTDQLVYPRVLEALNTDGSALATVCLPLVYGRPKVVIASGGSAKSGSVILYIMDI